MSISEQEALARQLCALYWEARGMKSNWDNLQPDVKGAWIILAQFVFTQIETEPDHK